MHTAYKYPTEVGGKEEERGGGVGLGEEAAIC